MKPNFLYDNTLGKVSTAIAHFLFRRKDEESNDLQMKWETEKSSDYVFQS